MFCFAEGHRGVPKTFLEIKGVKDAPTKKKELNPKVAVAIQVERRGPERSKTQSSPFSHIKSIPLAFIADQCHLSGGGPGEVFFAPGAEF